MAQPITPQDSVTCHDAFQRLADLIPQGAVVVDTNNLVLYANKAAQKSYQIHPGDSFEIPHFHPNQNDQTLTASVRITRANSAIETLALELRATTQEWGGQYAHLIVLGNIPPAAPTDEDHPAGENRYHAIIERQNTLIFRFRPDTTITYANSTSCHFLGRERDEIVGSSILNYLPPESRRNVQRHVSKLLRNGRMEVIEFPVIISSGEMRWLQMTDQPIPDKNGNITEIQAVARDISQRKMAEGSLVESEARYRALVEDSPAMICRFRPDGTLIYVNETLCTFFERERADLIGSSVFDLMTEENRDRARSMLQRPEAQTRRITVEGQSAIASGQVRWTRWTNRPILDMEGHCIEFQAVGIDITKSKFAEDALRASEARFRDLLENMHLVAILLSLDGSVLFVNDFFTQLTGFSAEEVLGRNWFEMIVPPEDRKRVTRSFNIMAKEGRLIPHGQNHIFTRSGERRLISWNTTLLRDPHGKLVGISSVGEDITERNWAGQLQEVVHSISQGTLTCESVEELYSLIHHSLEDVMPVENFFISIYDTEQEKLTFPYYIDQYDAPPEAHPLGPGLTEYVLRTGKPLLASPEVFQELIESGEVQEIGAPSVDWLGVPLRIGQKTTGVMVIQSYTEGVRFNQRDLQILDFVSTQIAATIERKRAEQALRENEEKYRALVEASTSAIFLETYEGDILDCNPSACRMLGYTKEEMLRLRVDQLIPPNLDAMMEEKLGENSGLRPTNWVSFNVRKDGTIFPISISSRTVFIGGQELAVVFMEDLTQSRQHEREMEAIAGVSAALRTAITQADILPVILDQLVGQLRVHGAFITLRNEKNECPRIVLGCGTWDQLSDRDLPNTESLCCKVIATGQMYLNNQAAIDPNFPFPDLIDGVKAIASVPLVTQDHVFGALTVGYEHPITPEEVHILTAISNIAASAIQRARLYEQTSKQAAELSEAYEATIEGWALALELRDKETQGHSRRVTELTTRLAVSMGVAGDNLVNLRRGVLLHDIGKMGIPDRILLKAESLTEEEWVLMRMHPEYAYRMLSSIHYLRSALDIPYCHHERWDGTGYPRGLQGEEIPLAARIFAVVDVMDALTSNRPYRPAWPREEAIQYIRRQSGRHFDPAVVEAFLHLPE
ncbi:MAG TPA: PAS domain S-box protein [Anaerolineaceae bacterium]